MKTKLFLTALAIPALFAACSAEEDFTLNNDQPVGGRKVINTDLSFNFVDDAATRLAIGDGAITLDAQDKVAAALIDEVSNNGTTAVNGYYITTGIATNHPFTKSGASWSTPTQLVEGNYLFYYQYNEGLAGNRGAAVPYAISKVQNAFTADAPTVFAGDQAVKDNAMGIGYAYLDADDNGQTAESIRVNMYNLFAFLKFNIKTDKTGLEVQQILVKRKDGNKFAVEGTITNSAVATEGHKNDQGNTTASDDHPLNAGILDGSNVTPATKKYTASYAAADGSKSVDYMILSMPDVAVNATAQSAYLVIPAADYTNGNAAQSEFVVDVYTNQGVFTREVELSHDENGVRDPKLSELAMGTVQPISLNITGTLTAANKYFVGTTAQWGKVLRSLPAPANATTRLNIEILNDVELSAADIALIESTQAKNYIINITGENIVLTEDCTVSDMTVAKMTVKAGAEVVLGKNLTVTTLTNKGKASVENVAGDNALPAIATLNNYGEFNVNGVRTKNGATLSIGTIANGNANRDGKADNSAVKLNVNKNLTVTTLNNYDAKEKANVSTIVVANGATLKTTTATNKGYIENSGMLLADGVFTNTGSKATIDNKETGIISNVNGGTKAVENLAKAEINAEAGSTTIVADNTGSTITYKDGANVSVTGSGAKKGKIAYVVTASYLTPKTNVEYNTIVVDGLNLKLRNAADDNTAGNKLTGFGITNVVLKNGATVDFTLQNAALTLIEVSGSNNKIITATAGLSSTTLQVNGSGYVLIPLNSKLTLTGATTGVGLQNSGTINVGGTLIYKAANAVPGTILGTGTVTAE